MPPAGREPPRATDSAACRRRSRCRRDRRRRDVSSDSEETSAPQLRDHVGGEDRPQRELVQSTAHPSDFRDLGRCLWLAQNGDEKDVHGDGDVLKGSDVEELSEKRRRRELYAQLLAQLAAQGVEGFLARLPPPARSDEGLRPFLPHDEKAALPKKDGPDLVNCCWLATRGHPPTRRRGRCRVYTRRRLHLPGTR